MKETHWVLSQIGFQNGQLIAKTFDDEFVIALSNEHLPHILNWVTAFVYVKLRENNLELVPAYVVSGFSLIESDSKWHFACDIPDKTLTVI